MKIRHIVLGLALAAMSFSSFAQNAGANATTDVHTSSGANAETNGNAQNINFNSPGDVKYSGSYTAHVAPSMVLGGFGAGFSSNNCANTAQVGLSTPVGGIVGGGGKESESCNRRQNGMMLSQQAVTAWNMGQREMAATLLNAANYEFCMAGGDTFRACEKLKLVGRSDPHINERYNDPAVNPQPIAVATPEARPQIGTVTVRSVK